MSKRIPEIECLDALVSINGVLMDEVDRRCQLLEDRTQDAVCWRLRSASGFISDGTRLVDVLRKDWEVVHHALGTTHTSLAAALAEVIEGARSMRAPGSLAPVELTFRGRSSSSASRIRVESFVFNAPQYSPFMRSPTAAATGKGSLPLEPLTVEFRGDVRSAGGAATATLCRQCWDTEHVLTNVESGVFVRVAEGVVGFIDEIGFYEGGDSNPYRVDPVVLWAVLYGKPQGNPSLACLIKDTLVRVGKALAADVLRPIESLFKEKEKGGCQSPEEEAWLKSFVEQERAKASEIENMYKSLGEKFT